MARALAAALAGSGGGLGILPGLERAIVASDSEASVLTESAALSKSSISESLGLAVGLSEPHQFS